MEIFFGWIVLSIVAGIIAGARGRSFFGFLLISIFLSPLVGIILAAALPNLQPSIEREAEMANSRACPSCAERIKNAARVCRFCGQEVEPIARRLQAEYTTFGAVRTAVCIVAALAALAGLAAFLAAPNEKEAAAAKEGRLQAAAPPMLPPTAPFADAPIATASSPKALPKDAKPKAPAGPLRITPQ